MNNICLIVIVALLLCVHSFNAFRSMYRQNSLINIRKYQPIFCTSSSDSNSVVPSTSTESDNTINEPIALSTEPVKDETPEEKYKREKLAEIAEKKAAEVFFQRDTGKYECQSCGYVYDTAVGMPKKGIAPGTPFDDCVNLRCPQCGASKKYFVAETETLSGFKENLKYGLGGNALTAGQKSNLIFGGLFVGFLIFMSGYLLE